MDIAHHDFPMRPMHDMQIVIQILRGSNGIPGEWRILFPPGKQKDRQTDRQMPFVGVREVNYCDHHDLWAREAGQQLSSREWTSFLLSHGTYCLLCVTDDRPLFQQIAH